MPSRQPSPHKTAPDTSLQEQLNFIPVPKGTVRLGLEQKIAERFISSYGEIWSEFFLRETPRHEVAIEAFELGRYPVTNGLYAQFIAAQGYEKPDYWTPDGWIWRVNTGRTQPLFWDSPKFAGETRPVVGLSWFEALALARWASIVTGNSVRLPSEAEWEWAAHGTQANSMYPWGGAWDSGKLNSSKAIEGDSPLGTTALVGSFSPAGDGPFGHADLLGQVWEWTSSLFRPYPYTAGDGREDLYTPEWRVLRGGSWSEGKYANRITSRNLYLPSYSDANLGVRLATGGSVAPIAPRATHDLVLYGRETFCTDVINTKKWLHSWNVPYRQVNIDVEDQAALRLDEWLGTRTTPTLVVADQGSIDPFIQPLHAPPPNLRNADRGSILHEPDEATLRAFLVRNGFLKA